MMASNRKDLFRQGGKAESGPQKDASKNIMRLHFSGVIISCITERKFSVYRAIEKLCTECMSQCCKPAIENQDTAKTIQESQSELIAGVQKSWASCAVC